MQQADANKYSHFISKLRQANNIYRKNNNISNDKISINDFIDVLQLSPTLLNCTANIDADGELFLTNQDNKIVIYCHNGGIYSGTDLNKNSNKNIENIKKNLTMEIQKQNYKSYMNVAHQQVKQHIENIKTKIQNMLIKLDTINRNINVTNNNIKKLSTQSIKTSMSQRIQRLQNEGKKTKTDICNEIIDLIFKPQQEIILDKDNKIAMKDKISLYEVERNELIKLKQQFKIDVIEDAINKKIKENVKIITNPTIINNDNKRSNQQASWLNSIKQYFGNKHPHIIDNITQIINNEVPVFFDNIEFKSNGIFNKAFWIEKKDTDHNNKKKKHMEKQILLYISPDGKIFSGKQMQLEANVFFANKLTNYDVIYDNGDNHLQCHEKEKTTHVAEMIDNKYSKELHNDIDKESNKELIEEIYDKSINSLKSDIVSQNSSQLLSNSQIENMNKEAKQEFSQAQQELNNLLSDNQKIQNAFNNVIFNKDGEQKKKNKNSITREVRKCIKDMKMRKLSYKDRRLLYFLKMKDIRKGKPEINLEDKNISLENSISK